MDFSDKFEELLSVIRPSTVGFQSEGVEGNVASGISGASLIVVKLVLCCFVGYNAGAKVGG